MRGPIGAYRLRNSHSWLIRDWCLWHLGTLASSFGHVLHKGS
ncbi:unnamed protein product [Haemonchus placei]|uniref:Uncharacterized protein n=1 Tax=Haemonchus placei TaxID=6290 RepID=A0A3P7U9U5_HAEPC|nr:unnamed protein product [Haemonchus placei]